MKIIRCTKPGRSFRLGVGVLLLGAASLLLPRGAFAVPLSYSISASASSDPLFTPVSGQVHDAVNGDFTIDGFIPPGGSTTGEGKDETTYWNFDFTGDLSKGDFDTALTGSYSLDSAILTLSLTPFTGYKTDHTSLGNTVETGSGANNPNPFTPLGGNGFPDNPDWLPNIGNSDKALYQTNTFKNMTDGVLNIVTLNLLDFYSTSDILDLYTNNGGIIGANYSDDSLLSSAQLELTVIPNPEPETLLLLGSGLVALAGWRMRQRYETE